MQLPCCLWSSLERGYSGTRKCLLVLLGAVPSTSSTPSHQEHLSDTDICLSVNDCTWEEITVSNHGTLLLVNWPPSTLGPYLAEEPGGKGDLVSSFKYRVWQKWVYSCSYGK